MLISSVKNSQIKKILTYKETKIQKIEKKYLVEGLHLVDLAIKNQKTSLIIIEEKFLKKINFKTKIELLIISDNVAKKLSDLKTASGIFAVCEFENNSLKDGNILVLDQIQDPSNLGAIIRSAKAFNFNNIYISKDSCSYYNPKVLRACQGNHFGLNLLSGDILSFLNKIKDNKKIITTFLDEENNVSKLPNDDVCLVLGNEGQGLNPDLKKIKHINFKINIEKNVDSLNLAISAAILMEKIYNN